MVSLLLKKEIPLCLICFVTKGLFDQFQFVEGGMGGVTERPIAADDSKLRAGGAIPAFEDPKKEWTTRRANNDI